MRLIGGRMTKIDAISKYSGSKARFADKVVDVIFEHDDGNRRILDICAGSGAVSLELRRRGVAPQRLTMIEAAHYGAVFDLMSKGRFSRKQMLAELDNLPSEPSAVQAYLEQLSREPVKVDVLLYRFLLLQSCAAMGKQVQYIGGAWSHAGFDSSRIQPDKSYRYVPPSAKRIMSRVDKYSKELYGVEVLNADATTVNYSVYRGAIIYIDPPYKNTAGYHYDLNLERLVKCLPDDCVILVSEAVPLSDDAQLVYRRHGRDEYVSRLR